jgi:hypothetical protein
VYCGVLEPETETHSLLRVGAESPEGLLAQVLMIGLEVELVEGAALLPELERVLGRMAATFAPPSR